MCKLLKTKKKKVIFMYLLKDIHFLKWNVQKMVLDPMWVDLGMVFVWSTQPDLS